MPCKLHFLGQYAAELFGLFGGIIKSLLRLDHFAVKGIHLALIYDAVLKLLLHLLFGVFQTVQLCLGLLHRAGQKPLFLLQQLCVGGVQLQQLLHIFQLALGAFDLLVHAGQGLAQTCRVAADLHGDALDAVCHIHHLLFLQ